MINLDIYEKMYEVKFLQYSCTINRSERQQSAVDAYTEKAVNRKLMLKKSFGALRFPITRHCNAYANAMESTCYLLFSHGFLGVK